jgi:hypothetical protein
MKDGIRQRKGMMTGAFFMKKRVYSTNSAGPVRFRSEPK